MGHVKQYTKQITNLKGASCIYSWPSFRIGNKFWYTLRVVITWSRFEGAWKMARWNR